LSDFIGFGTGKPLATESPLPQSPGASSQGGNSPKADTGSGSPRAAQRNLEDGEEEESPKKTGKKNGKIFLTLMR